MKNCFSCLLLAILCLTSACASRKSSSACVPHPLTKPVSELGTVGVVVTNQLHNFTVNRPMEKGEAWRHGMEINKRTFMPFEASPPQLSIYYMPIEFFIHAMVTLNAATMSGLGVPNKDFAPAHTEIKQVCRKLERRGEDGFNEQLKTAVTAEWESRTITPIVHLEPGVTKTNQRVTLYPNLTYPNTLPPGVDARRHLLSKGVDTLLEVQIKDYGLKGSGKVNPALAIEVQGNVRLVSLHDNKELAVCPFQYKGRSRRYVEWGVNSAELLIAEVDACYSGVAREVVNTVINQK